MTILNHQNSVSHQQKNMNRHLKIKETHFQKYARAESTDDENSESDAPQQKITINKYKTQMCKNFSQNGYCPYFGRCQFAHGKEELCRVEKKCKTRYQTQKCRPFWHEGVCKYGKRCQFSHAQTSKTLDENPLKALLGVLGGSNEYQYPQKQSRLISQLLLKN